MQCLRCRRTSSNTQNCSAACVIGQTGHTARIPRSILFIRLKIGVCTVLMASSTRLTPTFLTGDPPGIVLHGKQPWLAWIHDWHACRYSFSTDMLLPVLTLHLSLCCSLYELVCIAFSGCILGLILRSFTV